MEIETLITICGENGLILSSKISESLQLFSALLAGWNSRINLISRKDEAHILDRHVLHSLVLRMPAICDYDFSSKRALDLGTGGGLPGIPVTIVTPSLDMTLVDSTQKKIAAGNAMIAELGLSAIRAIAARAEELAKSSEHTHAYDVIVSRAVAPLEDLVKWSYGLLKPGGTLLALKGGDITEECSRARQLTFVADIRERPLDLVGYDALMRDEKKLVIVKLR